MSKQTIKQIFDVAISEGRICVEEGSSAETIPNYEANFVEKAIEAMRLNPYITEIYLVGMSDNTIKTLIPHIATLKSLQKLELGYNYIKCTTAQSLVDAVRDLPLKSFNLQGNEFLTEQLACPSEIAEALLSLPSDISICVYENFYDMPHIDQRAQLMADTAAENE